MPKYIDAWEIANRDDVFNVIKPQEISVYSKQRFSQGKAHIFMEDIA